MLALSYALLKPRKVPPCTKSLDAPVQSYELNRYEKDVREHKVRRIKMANDPDYITRHHASDSMNTYIRHGVITYAKRGSTPTRKVPPDNLPKARNKISLLWSVGPVLRGYTNSFTVIEQIKSINEIVESRGSAFWGVRFLSSPLSMQEKGVVFPIRGLLYLPISSESVLDSQRGYVSFQTIVEDVETYPNPQAPSDINLLPELWRDRNYKNYLKCSSPIVPISPQDLSVFSKWDGSTLGLQAVHLYAIIVRSTR